MVRREGAIEDHPAVAVHGSLIYALVGKASDAERWATAAERSTVTGMLDDGNTMEGTLAYLRTLLCRTGLDEMRRDAQLALDGLSPTSPYRPAMLHAEASPFCSRATPTKRTCSLRRPLTKRQQRDDAIRRACCSRSAGSSPSTVARGPRPTPGVPGIGARR